jgi:tetratricopeptide (TPR) repeat protein
MEYIRFQYDPQFKLPTENQTQEAFQRIVEKYGEKKPDGRVQVSGQDAVMAINSLLLEQMAKDNPNRAFAVQESFRLEDTYAHATLAGPLYVFGAESAPKEPTRPNSAPAEIVTFWQSTVSQFQSAPNSETPDVTRSAYAKLASGQANVLISQGNTREAEQTLRLANQLDPSLPDATYPLIELYVGSGRSAEALAVVDRAIAQAEHSPSTKNDALKGFRQLRTQLLNPKP